MAHQIEGLHHLGHVVPDMTQALRRYRNLGFTMTAPAYPALPPEPGAEPRACGVGNSHADFAGGFIEVVAVSREGEAPGPEAKVVPLSVPPEQLPQIRASINETAANLSACLVRFEGLHILLLDTPDIAGAARRLQADGIEHGGARFVQRPIATATGSTMVPAGYLEFDGDRPGLLPEGRIGVAQGLPEHLRAVQELPKHPNGATALVEAVLCVAETELADVARRYAGYVERTPHRTDDVVTFDLPTGRIRIVTPRALRTEFPGASETELPALAAFGVAVDDLARTRRYLEGRRIPLREVGERLIVPATQTGGVAIGFVAQ